MRETVVDSITLEKRTFCILIVCCAHSLCFFIILFFSSTLAKDRAKIEERLAREICQASPLTARPIFRENQLANETVRDSTARRKEILTAGE